MRYYIYFILMMLVSPISYGLDWGLNLHSVTDPTIIPIMSDRNLKNGRFDLFPTSNVQAIRDQVARIRMNGGRAEGVVLIPYHGNNSCNLDYVSAEATAYSDTYAIVDKYKDLIYDYELMNENTLKTNLRTEVPVGSVLHNTSVYPGKPCYGALFAVLRGMSRAVMDIKASSGYPLRTVLGVVNRDYGFVTYARSVGVMVNVVGYHIYPKYNAKNLDTDTWFGTGGLYANLAILGLPVKVNEFNCGDIYDATYDNIAGSPTTLNCLTAYKNHLPVMINQNKVNIEEILIYEMVDNPAKPGAEGRFGLMYNYATPKSQLYGVTAYSGGKLTYSEKQSIVNQIPDYDIDLYKNRRITQDINSYLQSIL